MRNPPFKEKEPLVVVKNLQRAKVYMHFMWQGDPHLNANTEKGLFLIHTNHVSDHYKPQRIGFPGDFSRWAEYYRKRWSYTPC